MPCIVLKISTASPLDWCRLVNTVQVVNSTTCIEAAALYTWCEFATILQLIPGAVTCLFIIIQFVRQSLQIYRATKQWQLNRYTKLFFREGIIYFLVYVISFLRILIKQNMLMVPLRGSTLVFSLVNLPTQRLFYSLTVKWLSGVLLVGSNVPVFALTPRFILSIRALFARDIRGTRGYGIDTGFDHSSPGNSSSSVTAIVFASIGRDEESERDEVIPTGGIQLTRSGSRD